MLVLTASKKSQFASGIKQTSRYVWSIKAPRQGGSKRILFLGPNRTGGPAGYPASPFDQARRISMPIRQYLDGDRFHPETTRLLGIAFETAIQALHNWGVLDPPREAIARAIIGFAKAGERDPERLCDLALEACSKPIISDPSPLPPHASPQAQPDS
jgi:hypothetical protein